MTKEEIIEKFPITQMICDSQGCREVDLFGNPVKNELRTLMSPAQFKELADREQIQCNNQSENEDEIRTSSFEVELGDEFSYICDNYQKGYNDAIEKALKWLKTINFEKDYIDRADYGGCFFKEEDFINDFHKIMEE